MTPMTAEDLAREIDEMAETAAMCSRDEEGYQLRYLQGVEEILELHFGDKFFRTAKARGLQNSVVDQCTKSRKAWRLEFRGDELVAAAEDYLAGGALTAEEVRAIVFDWRQSRPHPSDSKPVTRDDLQSLGFTLSELSTAANQLWFFSRRGFLITVCQFDHGGLTDWMIGGKPYTWHESISETGGPTCGQLKSLIRLLGDPDDV